MGNVGEIKIDKVDFIKKVDKLKKKYNITARHVAFDMHRLYTEDLARGTIPKKAAAGKTILNKDIDKIFIPINNPDVLNFYAEEFGKKAKSAGKKVKQAVSGIAESKGLIFNWNGDVGKMKQFHKRHRTGPQKGVAFRSDKIKIGNFDFGTGMYVPKTKLSAYKKIAAKNLFQLKAGWIPALQHFRGKMTGMAFVAKQPLRHGGWSEKFNKLTGSGTLTSINSVPWASKKLKILIRFATKKRQVAYEKYFKRQLDITAKNWSASPNG